jgi:hypothetical protein
MERVELMIAMPCEQDILPGIGVPADKVAAEFDRGADMVVI